jgi:1-acyl-sn-glycerol-3-phosphate acyltransferase
MLSVLERLWRLFGTTISFAVFGLGGVLYGLVLFPLTFIIVRDRARRRAFARRMIGWGFGAFAGLMRGLGVVDYQIEGRENIDDQRRQLIIANHPTLIDVVLLISLFPQVNCVIKEAVRRNPFMGSTVRAAEYISNSEPEELLAACVEYLRNDKSLLLFPEGTRTRHDESIFFRQGAAAVAVRAGADVQPVAIKCEPLVLSKQLPWYHVPRAKPLLAIRVLPPRPIAGLVPHNLDPRQERQQLNQALLDIINTELADMAFSGRPN